MNRTIKFRAWDKIRKVMIIFDQPSVCEEYSCLTWESNQYAGIGKLPGSYEKESPEEFEQQECYEIMEFTGLKDKNGKEIYEGDLLKSHLGTVDVMEWNTDDAAFTKFSPLIYFEVIGNIYENSSLLS